MMKTGNELNLTFLLCIDLMAVLPLHVEHCVDWEF